MRDAKRHMWMEVGRVAADVQKLKVQELAEGNLYFLRIYAKNEVGFSDHLENEEPFKVVRPAGKNIFLNTIPIKTLRITSEKDYFKNHF